jgi:FixJ family two-component response regulator
MTLLTSRTYDLVFLDLHMPDLTGGQVLGRLQEYDDRPPVVLITGFSETPMMDQALHYDLLYVLSKPFVREQVLKLLHSVRATKVLPYTDSSPARSAGYVPSARPVA